MSTVTISKTHYNTLRRQAKAYQRMVSVVSDEFVSPPKSRAVVMKAFKKTGKYNAKFLESLNQGLKRSTYFSK